MTSYYCSWVCKSAGQFFWSQMDSLVLSGRLPVRLVAVLILGGLHVWGLRAVARCWMTSALLHVAGIQEKMWKRSRILKAQAQNYNFCHILLANTSYKVSPDPQRSCKVTMQKMCIQGGVGNSGIFCNWSPLSLKKLSISPESYNILHIYCPQNIKIVQGEIDKMILIVGGFNLSFAIIDKSSTQKHPHRYRRVHHNLGGFRSTNI